MEGNSSLSHKGKFGTPPPSQRKPIFFMEYIIAWESNIVILGRHVAGFLFSPALGIPTVDTNIIAKEAVAWGWYWVSDFIWEFLCSLTGSQVYLWLSLQLWGWKQEAGRCFPSIVWIAIGVFPCSFLPLSLPWFRECLVCGFVTALWLVKSIRPDF